MPIHRSSGYFLVALLTISASALIVDARKSGGAPPPIAALERSAGEAPETANSDAFNPRSSILSVATDDFPVRSGSDKVDLGDRLTIKFFEHIDLLGQPNRRASFGLIEQSVLSGNYVVQQSGFVVLPVLGAVEAADLSIGDLEGELRKRYQDAFKQNAKVSVAVDERQPIYVLGAGPRAGTYKFTPGMTVLHALALVGGGEDDRQQDVYLQSELVRQRERNESGRRQLMKTLARSIVLRAESEGRIPEAPASFIKFAGTEKASTLIKEEQSVRDMFTRIKRMELDAHRTLIASTRQEIGEINKNIAILNENLAVKNERKRAIASLRDQRLANTFIENQVASELLDATEREHQARLNLARAKHKLAEAEAALEKLTAEHALELEKELATVTQSVADLETIVVSSEQFINELRLQSTRTALANRPVTFEIVRQMRDGPTHQKADEMTTLKPGDLVRVSTVEPLQR